MPITSLCLPHTLAHCINWNNQDCLIIYIIHHSCSTPMGIYQGTFILYFELILSWHCQTDTDYSTCTLHMKDALWNWQCFLCMQKPLQEIFRLRMSSDQGFTQTGPDLHTNWNMEVWMQVKETSMPHSITSPFITIHQHTCTSHKWQSNNLPTDTTCVHFCSFVLFISVLCRIIQVGKTWL